MDTIILQKFKFIYSLKHAMMPLGQTIADVINGRLVRGERLEPHDIEWIEGMFDDVSKAHPTKVPKFETGGLH